MTENQTNTAETATPENGLITVGGPGAPATAVTTEDAPPDYQIRVENAGPGTRKIWVEVPRPRIDSKLAEQFKELRSQAAIPGFRPGHAPRKLVEKRFQSDVREQVRRSLISESYEQAVAKNNLTVIGEPEFDNPDAIKLPDEGPMVYSFSVEVQPEFVLPNLVGLKVTRRKLEVKDEHVDQAIENLREQQAVAVPIEGRGVQENDYIAIDGHLLTNGQVVDHAHNLQLTVKPGRIFAIQIDDLPAQLAGMNVGEKRTFTVHAPADHPMIPIRDQDAQIEVALRSISKLDLPDLNAEFLDKIGFSSSDELRKALREQMDLRVAADIQQSMRDQVQQYLLQTIAMELPERLSDRQSERIVRRRAIELLMRGMSEADLESRMEELRRGARDAGLVELKRFFILEKLASNLGVDVAEAELNGYIADMALRRDVRPEKLKQEMAADGRLTNLYVEARERKALDKVLALANIVDAADDSAISVVAAPEAPVTDAGATANPA